jgi:hypothetical protein
VFPWEAGRSPLATRALIQGSFQLISRQGKLRLVKTQKRFWCERESAIGYNSSERLPPRRAAPLRSKQPVSLLPVSQYQFARFFTSRSEPLSRFLDPSARRREALLCFLVAFWMRLFPLSLARESFLCGWLSSLERKDLGSGGSLADHRWKQAGPGGTVRQRRRNPADRRRHARLRGPWALGASTCLCRRAAHSLLGL